MGVIRILVEKNLPLELPALVAAALPAFGERITDPTAALLDFFHDRLAVSLRDPGDGGDDYTAQEVEAVLALRPPRLGDIPRRLEAVRAFAALPEAAALAAANKRVGNILKKADAIPDSVDPARFVEAGERDLYAARESVLPGATAAHLRGDYAESLRVLAALRGPVDAFFDGVMVNAEDVALRNNRLALLGRLHAAMNRVADLGRLAA